MVLVISKLVTRLKKVPCLLKDTRGEGFVEDAVKIITVIVIGVLILGFFYLLFNSTLLPMVRTKLLDMFNYSG